MGMLDEAQKKEELMKEDERTVDDFDVNHLGDGDPLKVMLEGFWFVFNDYEKEFGAAREQLKSGHPVYDQLVGLQAELASSTPPTEEEAVDKLYSFDLKSVGAEIGPGYLFHREISVNDLVE